MRITSSGRSRRGGPRAPVRLVWLSTLAFGAVFPVALGGCHAPAPAASGPLPATSGVLEITLRPDDERQTIRGFGASDAWTMQFVGAGWPEAKRRRIADLLFSLDTKPDGSPVGIGLSIWRFNIGGGSAEQGAASGIPDPWRRAESFLRADGGYDWSRQAGQRWFLRAAKARGVPTLIGFVNSPPVAFTRNGLAFSSGGASSNLAPGHVDDYARYLRDVVVNLERRDGVRLDAVSPVNEPQWDWLRASAQEGSPWTNADIHATVAALSRAFHDAGLATGIEVPEAGKLTYLYEDADKPRRGSQLRAFFDPRSPTYIGGLLNVAHGVAAHSYFTTYPESALVATRARLRDTLRAVDPRLELWMSEYCVLEDNPEIHGRGRDLGMTTALYVARVIHADLATAGASAWEWWLGVSAGDYKDGLVYLDRNPTGGAIHDSRLLWALGNYARFVRPGMRRIAIARSDGRPGSDPTASVLVSAYRDPVTGRTVVVAVNEGSTGAPLRLRGPGLARVREYVTSAAPNDELRFAGEREAAWGLVLPARSLVTLVAR